MFSLARTAVKFICTISLARALLMIEMRHHQRLLHDKSCALPYYNPLWFSKALKTPRKQLTLSWSSGGVVGVKVAWKPEKPPHNSGSHCMCERPSQLFQAPSRLPRRKKHSHCSIKRSMETFMAKKRQLRTCYREPGVKAHGHSHRYPCV